LAYSFNIFWGFNGALAAVRYPSEWEAAREVIDSEGLDAGLLVLPWDSYSEYAWVPNDDKTVRTLPKAYFAQPQVFPEIVIKRGGIFDQSSSPEQAYVKALIDEGHNRDDFGARIVPLGVRFVVLTDSAEAGSYYRFLHNQSDLELLMETDSITLFRNRDDAPRAYWSPEPFLGPDAIEALATRISPARYEVGAGQGYLIFVPPDSTASGWRLNGVMPLTQDPEYLAVWEAPTEGASIAYAPFRTNLIWITISGGSALALLAIWTANLFFGPRIYRWLLPFGRR
jgi:hypothetical protein